MQDSARSIPVRASLSPLHEKAKKATKASDSQFFVFKIWSVSMKKLPEKRVFNS